MIKSHCYVITYPCSNPDAGLTDFCWQKRPLWYFVTRCKNPTLHWSVPHPRMRHFVTEMCTFLFQNGALWDICLVHCGICEIGPRDWLICVKLPQPNSSLSTSKFHLLTPDLQYSCNCRKYTAGRQMSWSVVWRNVHVFTHFKWQWCVDLFMWKRDQSGMLDLLATMTLHIHRFIDTSDPSGHTTQK